MKRNGIYKIIMDKKRKEYIISCHTKPPIRLNYNTGVITP